MQQASLFVVAIVNVTRCACFQGAFRPKTYSQMLFVKVMGFVCEKVFPCLMNAIVAF